MKAKFTILLLALTICTLHAQLKPQQFPTGIDVSGDAKFGATVTMPDGAVISYPKAKATLTINEGYSFEAGKGPANVSLSWTVTRPVGGKPITSIVVAGMSQAVTTLAEGQTKSGTVTNIPLTDNTPQALSIIVTAGKITTVTQNVNWFTKPQGTMVLSGSLIILGQKAISTVVNINETNTANTAYRVNTVTITGGVITGWTQSNWIYF